MPELFAADADYARLPADLPVPEDDGACAHLAGLALPALQLPSSRGGSVDLAALPDPVNVLFFYPMTGTPGVPLPDGWDAIPGARGCTPQNVAISDGYAALRRHGAGVYAISTQTTAEQAELAGRLKLPYAILSDANLALAGALNLPTFTVDGRRLIRRLTLLVRDQAIARVFHPVFPPDRCVEPVLAALAGG